MPGQEGAPDPDAPKSKSKTKDEDGVVEAEVIDDDK
jgi:hypothetical protein